MVLGQRQAVLDICAFGTKRPEVLEKLAMIEWALGDLCLIKKDENAPLSFFYSREKAADTAYMIPNARLFRIYRALIDAKTDVAANSNIRLTLTRFISASEIL